MYTAELERRLALLNGHPLRIASEDGTVIYEFCLKLSACSYRAADDADDDELRYMKRHEVADYLEEHDAEVRESLDELRTRVREEEDLQRRLDALF